LHIAIQLSEVNDLLGAGVIFQLELKDKSYLLRARTAHQAEQWMKVLKEIKKYSGEQTAHIVEARKGSKTKLIAERKSDSHAPVAAATAAPTASKSVCCVIS
jgi:RNA-splicing ligase RtcB